MRFGAPVEACTQRADGCHACIVQAGGPHVRGFKQALERDGIGQDAAFCYQEILIIQGETRLELQACGMPCEEAVG